MRLEARDAAAADRQLATASAAVLGGRVSVLVFDLPHGADAVLRDRVASWLARHRALLGGRLDGVAFVLPGWFSTVLTRLDLAGAPPPTAWTVVRSVDSALAWADLQG